MKLEGMRGSESMSRGHGVRGGEGMRVSDE